MTDSSNPYQPPGSDQTTEAHTPRVRDLVAATIVSLLGGVSVFLATCFGSGVIMFGYTYPGPAPAWVKWADPLVFVCFVLLGIGTSLFLGRIAYNARRRTRSESEEH